MRIVHKIEDGMDRNEVLCTTYQMRNFYRQFGDGFFNVLDVMNYIQHCYALKLCKSGHRVLDVCCGRGLMLPLLRYHRKDIKEYVGVDIKESNAIFTSKRVTDGKAVDPDEYYPFEVSFVHANVAEMSMYIDGPFDVILFMASIEHMHKIMGDRALAECRRLIAPDGTLLVTCPNTPEDRSGYDTQYAAHVYEWKRSELVSRLEQNGFTIMDEWCILANKREIAKHVPEVMMERLSHSIPYEWLCAALAPLCTSGCKEIAILARPTDGSGGVSKRCMGSSFDIDVEEILKGVVQ